MIGLMILVFPVMALTQYRRQMDVPTFCFDQGHRVEATFLFGDHLLMKVKNRVEERPRPLVNYLLYNWRTGHLSQKLWHQSQLFPNISSQEYKLQFATTYDLCELTGVVGGGGQFQSEWPRKRRSVQYRSDELEHLALSASAIAAAHQAKKRTVADGGGGGGGDIDSQISEIKTVLKRNLLQTVDQDHETIKSQLRMFDAQLQLLNERLSKTEQPAVTSTTTTTTTPATITTRETRTATVVRPGRTIRQPCGQLVVATFCHPIWSFESQICRDNGQPCWYRTMFYQYLAEDDPDAAVGSANPFKFALLTIPFKFKLMSHLLNFRGMFQMSDPKRFLQVNPQMRCENVEADDRTVRALRRAILQHVVDLRLGRLVSGFRVGSFDLVQSVTGHLEFLDGFRVRIPELLNCFENSTVFRKRLALQYERVSPWNAAANQPLEASPPPDYDLAEPSTALSMAAEPETETPHILDSPVISQEPQHSEVVRSVPDMFDDPRQLPPGNDYPDSEYDLDEDNSFWGRLAFWRYATRLQWFFIFLILFFVAMVCLFHNRIPRRDRLGGSRSERRRQRYRRQKISRRRRKPSSRHTKHQTRKQPSDHDQPIGPGEKPQPQPESLPANDNVVVIEADKIKTSILDPELTYRIESMMGESQLITKMFTIPKKVWTMHKRRHHSTTTTTGKGESSGGSTVRITADQLAFPCGSAQSDMEEGPNAAAYVPREEDRIYAKIGDENTKLVRILYRLRKSLRRDPRSKVISVQKAAAVY